MLDMLQYADIEALTAANLACQACGLRRGCTQVVISRGRPQGRVMLVGEGPGANEDRLGQPFVGAAGQLLDKILVAAELPAEDVYITNVIKCRPPGNRNPQPDEISRCEPFLKKQLRLIAPEVICALGTFAAKTLLKTDIPISVLRGRFHSYEGIKLMPTYHPAYLLRNPAAKKQVWEDVKIIMKELNLPY